MKSPSDVRGIGTTTNQMISAPYGSAYIWVTDDTYYPRKLAEKIGRTDLVIKGPGFLGDLTRGFQFPMVVVDHAFEAKMTKEESIKIEYLKAYAGRSQNLMIQAGWVYTLVIDGKEVNREVSNTNWDPRYQPFGRPGIDFVQGGHVYKEAVFIIKKPKLSECYLPPNHD